MKIGCINRKEFDKLGDKIRGWLEEQGFETNAQQDAELMKIILDYLEIKIDFGKIRK